MVLQTLAHRCRKTKIDLNLYRVKKITWEATGTLGRGGHCTGPLSPSRAAGNDSSSWIYISLFSALIISSDYLEATVHHPFHSQKLPHTIAPTCPRPQPASFPSTGLNPEAALENSFFSLLLGSFLSSRQLFLSTLPASPGLFCLLLMGKVHHHLTTPCSASQQPISASQNLPAPCFSPFKAFFPLAPIPKCFCSTPRGG